MNTIQRQNSASRLNIDISRGNVMTAPPIEIPNTTSQFRNALRPTAPYDLSKFKAFDAARAGQDGFLTEAQRTAMPHIVHLAGLTREIGRASCRERV